MKNKIKTLVGCILMAGMFNLTTATSLAAGQIAPAPAPAKVALASPKIISAKKPLSAHELAKYQQMAADSKTAANHRAAGSNETVVWIVVGVVVVVGVIALAGGGGGGGGGY